MKVTLIDGIPQETEINKAQVVIEIEGCMFLIALFALLSTNGNRMLL